MTLGQFLSKQFIRVIQWNESEDGVLAYRYPMQDMEIENGGQLTVRETQMAAFINEGKIADVFGPGMHTLSTRNLPILTDLMNWSKDFESPFKSDVYFFSTRLQMDQKWGTATTVTVRDKEFGAVRVRAYGNYSYRIADPRVFFTKVSGTRESYYVAGSGIAVTGNDCGADGGSVCRQQCFVPGYGGEPGGAGGEDCRSDEAGIRGAWARDQSVCRRERFASGRVAEGDGPADWNGHGRGHWPINTV